jgi:hypothetical protein
MRPRKNPKSRFELNGQIPSENEWKSTGFAPYGTAVDEKHIDGLLPSCNNLSKKERGILRSAARYAIIAQRIALSKFINPQSSRRF